MARAKKTDNVVSLFDEADATSDEAVTATVALQLLSWEGETVDYADAMRSRGRAYGSYVNTSRALPDARDGLKPVQRRIIVAMSDLGLRSSAKYAKSAKTVGHTIATYHPHGDSAVYDAMVRMAQPWQGNAVLVDGQGNWGDLHNDAPAAAQRYTECRLSEVATEFLADLRPEVVTYEPNFDETATEPRVLPVTIPNLLVNGSMGVGWAMACSVPPHNLGEAIDAALLVLEDPSVPAARLKEALPGPDLPGGGVIVNPEALADIYETGRGTVTVQGRLEQVDGGGAVRITELPYQVSAQSLVEQIVDGARKGKITEIFTAELPKNLTDADGIDVQVKVKRGGSVERLTAELLAHTRLQETLAFNFTVLVEGSPRTVSLRELLGHFVAFRTEVVTARLEHERATLARRVHLLLGARAAVDVIDKVVRIVRAARDDDDAKAQLIAILRYVPHGARRKVPIDDAQAQYIIDMALKRLNTLNRAKLDEELAEKRARMDAISAVLAAPGGVSGLVRDELIEAKRRFANPRRTRLARRSEEALAVGAAGKGADRFRLAQVEGDDLWAWVSSDAHLTVGRRGQKGVPKAPRGTSGLRALVPTSSEASLLVFTTLGRVHRVALDGHPVVVSGRRGRLVALDPGDAVAAVLDDEGPFYLVVTRKGQLKRFAADTLARTGAAGARCCTLDRGDEVVTVVGHGEAAEAVIAKAGGQVVRLDLGAIRPVASASAGTVAGTRVASGDRVVAASLVEEGAGGLVVLQTSGAGLMVPAGEFPVQGRGGAGVQAVISTKPARAPAGELAAIGAGEPGANLLVFSDAGGVQRLVLEPAGRRAAVSRPLLEEVAGAIAGMIPSP